MDRSQLPIGVFDSGLGGLTVVKALSEILPAENLIYVGDTARVPYGTKSPSTIRKYALQISFFLLQKKVKALVVACNSVSAVALSALKDLPIPVVGVIDPGARAATESASSNIAVIGTRATISSHAYAEAIHRRQPRARVWEMACPLLVPLVEEGWTHHPITRQVCAEYLKPLKKHSLQSLVLGCTHYPLLKEVIQSVVGRQVVLIDSAEETAKDVKRALEKQQLRQTSARKGRTQFFVTDNPSSFQEKGEKFFGHRLPAARLLRFENL